MEAGGFEAVGFNLIIRIDTKNTNQIYKGSQKA